jgi:hypothetical protein
MHAGSAGMDENGRNWAGMGENRTTASRAETGITDSR